MQHPDCFTIYTGKPVGLRSGQMPVRKHSSGLVNFAPESRLPFTGKRPRKPETGIKDGFEEMEHEFPFGISIPSGQTGLPFQMFRFRWEDPESRVPFTFQPDFPENVC